MSDRRECDGCGFPLRPMGCGGFVSVVSYLFVGSDSPCFSLQLCILELCRYAMRVNVLLSVLVCRLVL